MKRALKTIAFSLAFPLSILCLSPLSMAYAAEGKKVNLGWEAKYASRYCNDPSPVAVKVLSAEVDN